MTTHQQMIPFMEPIHVLGAGSIGLLFSASIRAAFPSYPLSLLLRDHHSSKIDDDEVVVCLMREGMPRIVPVPAQLISTRRQRPIKTLVLATKSFAAAEAVQSIIDRFDQSSAKIIIICNGAFSVKEELQEVISKQSPSLIETLDLVLATTTHGAYRELSQRDDKHDDDMYRVVHAGVGKTFIEEHGSISQLWDQSGLHCRSISKDEMNSMLWRKLAANCGINPLTALLQCENGHLSQPLGLDYPSIDEIVQEVSQVALAVVSDSGSAACQEASVLSFDSLRQFVDTVIEDTQHNKSSMLQDVLKGHRTEIDYLNGYVSKKGRDLGIETPANDDLCKRIDALTSSFA